MITNVRDRQLGCNLDQSIFDEKRFQVCKPVGLGAREIFFTLMIRSTSNILSLVFTYFLGAYYLEIFIPG